MIYGNRRLSLLAVWAVFLLLGILMFQFLHECGHGLGAKLEGYQVSTGFDKVGDVGKRPSVPDFRLNKMVLGGWNASDFFGPLANWLFAGILAALFLRQKTADHLALLIGSGAILNAFMRFFPMLMFFVSALQGRFLLEDEVALGLSAIKGLNFPMRSLNFNNLSAEQSSLFLSEAAIYFWPAVSFLISTISLALSYRQINLLIRRKTASPIFRWLFMFMPLIIWPLAFLVGKRLDNLIRIN